MAGKGIDIEIMLLFLQEFIRLWLQYTLIALAVGCSIVALRWLKKQVPKADAMTWVEFFMVIGLIIAFMLHGPMLIF